MSDALPWSDRELTAPCGLYCGDCIHLRNRHSRIAGSLLKELEKVGFPEYAGIETEGFGSAFSGYEMFAEYLKALGNQYCAQPCSVGGGCSGKPCAIMDCLRGRALNGCWECNDLRQCGKFDFLTPRCGKAPKDNCRIIRKKGLENWAADRHKFYIWL